MPSLPCRGAVKYGICALLSLFMTRCYSNLASSHQPSCPRNQITNLQLRNAAAHVMLYLTYLWFFLKKKKKKNAVRWLVVRLLLRGPRFDPRPVDVTYMAGQGGAWIDLPSSSSGIPCRYHHDKVSHSVIPLSQSYIILETGSVVS